MIKAHMKSSNALKSDEPSKKILNPKSNSNAPNSKNSKTPNSKLSLTLRSSIVVQTSANSSSSNNLIDLTQEDSPLSQQETPPKKPKTTTTSIEKTSETISATTYSKIPSPDHPLDPDTIEPISPESFSLLNHSVIELPEFVSHLIALDILFSLPRPADNSSTPHALHHFDKLECYLFDDAVVTELSILRNIHHC